MDGILPVYKPVGITSFDVIRAFKRAQFTGRDPVKYKVGHGGTLDPFADGVLLLLLGKATKRMNELAALPKTYRAVARLGASSDTLDRTGHIDLRFKVQDLRFSLEQLNEQGKKFWGEIEQEIPDYSATKINGVPRYKLARAGKEMEKKTKIVKIDDLRFTKIEADMVEFVSTVSSGTYIRQLSYDLFKSLAIESYLESLTRTKIGEYSLEKCAKIDDFSDLKWQEKVTT